MKNNSITKIKQTKGITLIALAITIMVLLILAGITISAITSDNGIIQNAGNAKEQSEIANEKEIIEKATVQAMGNNKYGNIEEQELQEQLDRETGKGKTEATDIGEEFEVIFTESSRYYIVDKDGNVGEGQDFTKDEHPGDFTIGENGEILNGEEKPYEISCIEDLVVLSNISRGKGNYIENEEIKEATQRTFSGKQFILTKNLNFNSTVSYADLSMTWRYDEEEEAYVIDETSTQNLRELLIDRNGVGFVPISEDTSSNNLMFAGNLDGQGFEIQNLYEITESTGGLFCSVYGSTIENLGLTNVDITSNGNVGGLSATSSGSSYFYNIYVSGNIVGKNAGGIAYGGGSARYINCCNLANIQGTKCVGGIRGYAGLGNSIIIVNCYNSGKLTSTGTSSAYDSTSGIIGWVYNSGTRNIINTCSLGSISKPGGTSQNFYNVNGGAIVNLENCYYLDSIINENVIANEKSIAFSRGDTNIIDKLNEYVNAHKYDYAVELYRWNLDSNGLPIFEK